MMNAALDQLDARTAEVAAQVAAQVVVRMTATAPAPIIGVEAFDAIVSAAVAEAVGIMRAEMDALRTELLGIEKVSIVERDGQGNIVTVTTTTIPAA